MNKELTWENINTIKQGSVLYFCNGSACKNEEKCSQCYRLGNDCFHTSNIDFSLTKLLGDKALPTIFKEFCDSGIFVETIDTTRCVYEMAEYGKKFVNELCNRPVSNNC